MAEKKLVLVLNASSEYIRHSGDDVKKYSSVMNKFFESINETYLPLLEMFERLEDESVPFRVGLVLSPVVCTLLEDSEIQRQYLEWVDKRIEFGKRELENPEYSAAVKENVVRCIEKNRKSKSLYEKFGGKLVRKFLDFHKKGFVELLATCGTNIFLPHYNDIPEVVNAQVETGFFAYKAFFGEMPEGFWLPELGYYPGIEKIVRAYKFNYTLLDSRSFLFSENEPEKGIFSPARFDNSLVAFSRYNKCDEQIFGEDSGYASNKAYLSLARDVCFEAPCESLAPFIEKGDPRYSFGYKYWNKGDSISSVYDFSKAEKCLVADAKGFLSDKANLFSEAEKCLPAEPVLSLVVTLELGELRKKWAEGLFWVENLFRFAKEYEISFANAKSLIDKQYSLQRIHPYYGSSSDLGYGENLLSSKNNWMMRYVRKASERMVDLSERFPDDTGLKARLLNLGSIELMMAQSSGWARMIDEDDAPEYAEMRFKQSINDFTVVFDALGSKTVSTEWLTKLENEHQIFPWMNYKIFNHKT